jgi:hypothetical protein
MAHNNYAQILKDYNNWRRGGDSKIPEPRVIGEAIDDAIRLAELVQGDVFARELRSSLAIAMQNTVAARVPECGDFGSIAQSLYWVCNQLGIAREMQG